MYRSYLKENIIKNLLAIILICLSYPLLLNSIRNIENIPVGDFLIVISILFISVQFLGFSFTYKDVTGRNTRIFAHIITFFAMLLTGFLLETMVVIIQVAYPQLFFIITFLSVLIYISVLFFDFWDFLKLKQES